MPVLASCYPKMNISWDDARMFLTIAESGSFSAAAKRLQLGQPTLSRRIGELEYHLGFTLFHRGKRGTKLSEDGERLLPAAQQMARWGAEFERAIVGRERAPEGRVRITAPPGIAFDFLVPFAAELRQAQPKIELEVLASIPHLDLARGEAELAIRTRAPHEPELASLYSRSHGVGVFGSPSYVAKLPKKPKLTDLDWVTWGYPNEHLAPRPELEKAIADFRPSFSSNDFLVQKRAVEAGLGVTILDRIRHPLVDRRRLVPVPIDLPLPTMAMHMVCAKSMEHVPRVRAVANALIAEFERIDAY